MGKHFSGQLIFQEKIGIELKRYATNAYKFDSERAGVEAQRPAQSPLAAQVTLMYLWPLADGIRAGLGSVM
jgi:hypothetical protein